MRLIEVSSGLEYLSSKKTALGVRSLHQKAADLHRFSDKLIQELQYFK